MIPMCLTFRAADAGASPEVACVLDAVDALGNSTSAPYNRFPSTPTLQTAHRCDFRTVSFVVWYKGCSP
jgi:hypothetical protein